VLRQAWERTGMRLLTYIIVPNHWHLVVWPQRDGELSVYAQWLTVTHVRRWHGHHHTAGTGPVRGAPYGDELWQKQTAAALGLESALRQPGRPRKQMAILKT
jgi:hypothetical protein